MFIKKILGGNHEFYSTYVYKENFKSNDTQRKYLQYVKFYKNY